MLSAVRSHQETCLKIKIMEITLVKTVSFLSHRKMIKHVKVQPAQLTLRVTCQKDTCGHGPALGRAWGLVQCFDNTQGPPGEGQPPGCLSRLRHAHGLRWSLSLLNLPLAVGRRTQRFSNVSLSPHL